MTPDEQLYLWLQGKSVHNPTRNECCPDFSCCIPELLAPTEIRQTFCTAHQEQNYKLEDKMSGAFLSKLIQLKFPNENIHIVEEPPC